jgi:hypothetical protein
MLQNQEKKVRQPSLPDFATGLLRARRTSWKRLSLRYLLLQGCRDGAEFGAEIGAHRSQSGNDHHRDQSGDQAVFDSSGAAIIRHEHLKFLEHVVFLSTLSHTMRVMDSPDDFKRE